MKSSLTILLSLCALGLTAPAPASPASSLELKAVFDRAVGDKCEAPEGSGDCRNTSKCKGISYPAGLCPKDPTDVQVSFSPPVSMCLARGTLMLRSGLPLVLRRDQMQSPLWRELLPQCERQRM